MSAPCFNCGAPSSHDHHVVPRSLGGVATVPLCYACHGKAHGRERPFRSTKELTRAALAKKRARGERTGTVPYGFVSDASGKLTPDAAEQATIDLVIGLRRGGSTYKAIADRLRSEGIATRRGRPMNIGTIHALAQLPPSLDARLSLRGIVAELDRVGIVGRTGKPLAMAQVQNILARSDRPERPSSKHGQLALFAGGAR